MPEANPASTTGITREEIFAVYRNQAAFLMSVCGGGEEDAYLEVFRMVNRFYGEWGINRVARVELSVKVSGNTVSGKRYTIPVNPYFEMNAEMMNGVLKSMNVPRALLDFINWRHGDRIRMGVGIDCDGGLKKVYFSEGERSLYAYGFRDDGRYGAKIYRMVRDGTGEEVLSCVRGVFAPVRVPDEVAVLFAEKDGYFVYDRFVLEEGSEIPSGFHIAPSKKLRIGEAKVPLTGLGRLCGPGLDDRAFDWWINRTSEAFLFWIGLGRNRSGNIELSLYVRNIDG